MINSTTFTDSMSPLLIGLLSSSGSLKLNKMLKIKAISQIFLKKSSHYLYMDLDVKKTSHFTLPGILTVPIAEILSGKNARAWVSVVLYLKK